MKAGLVVLSGNLFRWFAIILVLAALFSLGCSSDEASFEDGDASPSDGDTIDTEDGDEPQPVTPKKVVVYYGQDESDIWSHGALYAMVVNNLLGHFATDVTIAEVKNYRTNDLDNYDAAVYIGSSYELSPPRAFLEDVYDRESFPVFWMGYHIDSFIQENSGFDADNRFGFRFTADLEGEVYNHVYYNGSEILRNSEDVYFTGIEIVDDQKCELTAYMQNDSQIRPYLVHCGEFWYMVTVPFSYMAPDVSIFADALHDFLKTDVKPIHRALVRIEDVSIGTANKDLLRSLADTFYDLGVPFSVGVIPLFKDPNGVWFEPGTEMSIGDSEDFLDMLRYLQSKGGTLIVHGYTHQSEGISGEDFEFWDENTDTPVADDSYAWAADRAKKAKQIFIDALGYEPEIWETPHYQASYVDYFAFSTVFSTVYERIRVFDELRIPTSESGEIVPGYYDVMPSPFVMYRTYYGLRAVPENLGYIDVDQLDELGVPENSEGKKYYAQQIYNVRDGVASFFFHAWQPVDELVASIENIREVGFEFVSVTDLLKEGPPAYIDFPSEDGDSTDGDLPDGDLPDGDSDGDVVEDGDEDAVVDGDTVIDGDSDSDTDQDDYIMCLYGSEACPGELGCHNGFCGACSDGSECKTTDGCRADGTCGECSDDDHCRSGEMCRHGFCLPSTIGELNIAIAPQDFEDMIEYRDTEPTFDCTVTANGVTYEAASTIRQLGNFSTGFPKKSFMVEFPEDSDHPGYSRKIKLKSDWGDPTLMRSYLAYHLHRKLTSTAVPRTRYWKVSINGSYYGLMLEVERIGGHFLEINGRNRENSMYEAAGVNPCGAFVPEADLESYQSNWDLKTGTDTDYSELIYFIEEVLWQDYLLSDKLLPTIVTNTEQNVHLDSYVPMIAVNAVISNDDNITNNFYFSWQTNQKGKTAWEFYPWDMDLSLGCEYTEDLDSLCMDLHSDGYWLNGEFPSDVVGGYPTEIWGNLLIHLLLGNPEYLDTYERTICDVLNSELYSERIPNLIDGLYEMLVDAVDEDTNDRNSSPADFDTAVGSLEAFFADRSDYLHDELGCD
jgi:uncharacterized protein YdaL/spore coat protein CotH